jgi:hypothetical protein
MECVGEDMGLCLLLYLRVEDVMRVSIVSRSWYTLAGLDGYWGGVFERQFGLSLAIQQDKRLLRKLILEILYAVSWRCETNVLGSVISFSSCDRPDEGPQNVLKPSTCYLFFSEQLSALTFFRPLVEMHGNLLLQAHCGCGEGRPCYWSSRGSRDPNRSENMELCLRGNFTLVTGVSVTPYRAFFQPRSPVYAPRVVLVKFVMDGREYFKSDEFSMSNTFSEQNFSFTSPALFIGGHVVVEFVDMQQRQTLNENDDFFICISHLRLHGILLRGYKATGLFKHVIQRLEAAEGEDALEDDLKHMYRSSGRSLLAQLPKASLQKF